MLVENHTLSYPIRTDGNDLLKYADDTYLIIPAVNVETRCTDLSHISEWAKRNNLKLNLAKLTKSFLLTANESKEHLNQLKFLNFTELTL